jgi:transposase
MAATCFHQSGYDGDKFRDALRHLGEWTVEIIKLSDISKGFVGLLRRWAVGCTLASQKRNRCIARI